MTHALPLEDFRARRIVLDPDDFALSDGKPDPPPRSLVDKDVWDHLTTLPTDVSIRTSNICGWALKAQNGIMSAWGESVMAILDEPNDPTLFAMRDVSDELYATTFELLHGFYRQAASSLRSCLELMLDGCCKAVSQTSASADSRFSFKACAVAIRSNARVQAVDNNLESRCGVRLFGDLSQPAGAGWFGDLYGRLSESTHARPGRTLGDTWKSNGPIYVGEAVRDLHEIFFETVCAACILACLGRPSLRFPKDLDRALVETKVSPTIIELDALSQVCDIQLVRQ